MDEPVITINGKTLTIAQAMTVRVAVGSFAMSLGADGLGDDAQGKAITAAYLARLGEVGAMLVV